MVLENDDSLGHWSKKHGIDDSKMELWEKGICRTGDEPSGVRLIREHKNQTQRSNEHPS